ncbi:MAG: FKBP-type peptidyl-prolyl cis-trans isomerase [Planctomycetaceae bacterium]
MRQPIIICLLAMTLTFFTARPVRAQAAPAQEKPAATELETVKDRFSYALGLNLGRQFQQQGLDINPAVVARGIAAILEGTEPELTEEDIQAVVRAYEQEQAAKREQAAKKNKEDGEAYLTANAKKDGVKTTRTGLQYLVLKEGTGKSPTTDSEVVVHYRGKFIDGKVFDQSYEGDAPTADEEPISFGVTQVISGWTEGLQLMKAGAKYRFFIPSGIAYGPMGRPGIPPNSTLVFDVELMKVVN